MRFSDGIESCLEFVELLLQTLPLLHIGECVRGECLHVSGVTLMGQALVTPCYQYSRKGSSAAA